jgi:DNA-binding MarR family transcriptional regulator
LGDDGADPACARLVARVRDEQDRRRNLVRLTPVGKAALKRLDKRVDAAQKALLEPLSASDRRELRRLLELLVESP